MAGGSGGSSVGSSSQIADEIILSADIKNDEIKDEDIKTTAAILATKLQALNVGTNGGVLPSTGVANAHIAAGAAIALSKLASDPLARANHTGTQLAATISDFATAAAAAVPAAWTTVKKTADESVTSDTTLSDDTHLTFAVAANKKYTFKFNIFYYTEYDPGFKYKLAGPTSPTIIEVFASGNSPGTTTKYVEAPSVSFGTTYTGNNVNAGNGFIEIIGILHNAGNAGSVTLQWAQEVSVAQPLTVRAGSYIEYIQID